MSGLVSISANAEKVLLEYASSKKNKKTQLRQLLQPFIASLGVTSIEQMAPYRQCIINILADVHLEDRIFQVFGRVLKRVGTTTLTERAIFRTQDFETLNEFEMAIRVSAQKRMSEEYLYLIRLWFNSVSSMLYVL